MANEHGKPVHGSINAAALTTAVQVPIYAAGTSTSGGATALVIGAAERLVITDLSIRTSLTSVVHVFLSEDNDATAEVGETVFQGQLLTATGLSQNFIETHRVGACGADVRVSSSVSATVNVNFTGYIIQV